MPESTLSLLNVFDLPPEQREILLHLTRKGAASPPELAETINMPLETVNACIEALIAVNKVRINPAGMAEIILGQTRKRSLPTQLLPVLLATDRLYTAQEIAALRTAVPMLQFARAKMGEFADHGPSHALRVKSFATQLGYLQDLNLAERHLLRAAALFHDVGNAVERADHPRISEDTVLKLTARGELPYDEAEAVIIGLLCRWHRGDYDSIRTDTLRGETIRTGLLASLLRIADKMDIDHRRYDYGESFTKILQFFYPQEMPYWKSLDDIYGVRICCGGEAPELRVEVFTREGIEDNVHIDKLRAALESTVLDCQIVATPVIQHTPNSPDFDGDPPLAIIAFPFDPHSLIMAAISRKHLVAAGYLVKIIPYADSARGTAWFWGEALPKLEVSRYRDLIIIGDRPNPDSAADVLRQIKVWREAGTAVYLLNRHEANWRRLTELIPLGVRIVLGGDWAYFWGSTMTHSDVTWGRIAALVTRDPTQSTIGIHADDETAARGFLRTIHEATEELPEAMENWSSHAETILKRINAPDRRYFHNQAPGFQTIYESLQPTRVDDRVLVFETIPAGTASQTVFWAMEAAIEVRGRLEERGIRYRSPYAIAFWNDGDGVEILAINHWREEEATPIRLLYPSDGDTMPEGHEGAIRIHVPQERAPAILIVLINACNHRNL